MEITNAPPPPRQPSDEQCEQQARLDKRVNDLQNLVTTAQKDSDFDLFCRRLQMTEILSNLQPEILKQIYLADFYTEFWKLAGEAHRKTKFAEEEKTIARQLIEQARREQNPLRRQYFALLMIVFDESQEASRLLDRNLLSPQLQQDLELFNKWKRLANNPLSSQLQNKIARNEQTMEFLQAKYSTLIKKHSQAVINEKTCPPVKDYRIWFCWLQGEENLPLLVRCCYNSIKQNAGRYEVCFLDERNFSNYVDIPSHIMDKFHAGKLSRTNFADILRVNLLERHGGLWLDSTILVTEPLENHEDFWQMPYFSQKFFHECDVKNPFAKFISYGRWATSIQGTSRIHNPLFSLGKELFNAYLQDFDVFLDYYLIDFTIAIAYENIPFVKREVDSVPINHTNYYSLAQHLNDSYSLYPFDKIFKNAFLHKLTYKKALDMTRADTVFREIQRRYAPETIKL